MGRLVQQAVVALLPMSVLFVLTGNDPTALLIAAAVILLVAVATPVRHPAVAVPFPAIGDLLIGGRHLHGTFRRASRPDTPGRPRPRAPGRELRPV